MLTQTSRGRPQFPVPLTQTPTFISVQPAVPDARAIQRQMSSHPQKMSYFSVVKPALQPMPTDPDKLKPALHDKIERMDGAHLSLLNRVLLQLEVEELAGRLSGQFDQDHENGSLQRIPELVREFRQQHPYV